MRPARPVRGDGAGHPPLARPRSSNAIEVEELRGRLERGENVTVLDVRAAGDRAEWFVPGSIHVDAYARLKAGDSTVLEDLALPAGIPIVTVCTSGPVSELAARLLERRGFDARPLAGGMRVWSLAWNTARLSAPGASLVQVRRTGKGCLSYIVGAGSEALVVDASLDPDVYLRLAAERGWRIRHVIDTHIHADHVSRSRALAGRAGAEHWLPGQRRARFPHRTLADGDELALGSVRLRALRTPGHTDESTCYLVDERWLLTGDTLFPSAVGRPDLEATGEEARQRALSLHASLERLFTLPPGLQVLAGHTSKPVPFDGVTVSATLGEVRRALQLSMDAGEFATRMLRHLPPTPANHRDIVAANEAGQLPVTGLAELEAGANRCAIGHAPFENSA